MGTPNSEAYEWCYKFATLTIVGQNVKFTLAMTPVQKGTRIGTIVRTLLDKAREHISISMAYADSEFCAVDALNAFEDAGIGYVIPSPKNIRVKRGIDRMVRDVKVIKYYRM